MTVLFASNIAATLLILTDTRRAGPVFLALTLIYAVVVRYLLWRKRLIGTPKENWASALLAVSVTGITIMAARASDAGWASNSNRTIFYLLVGSTALACYVGKPTYRLMVKQERTVNPRQGVHLMILSFLAGASVICTGISVLLLLGQSLGFETVGFGASSPTSWAKPQILAGVTIIALVGIGIARTFQPTRRSDDHIRVNVVSYILTSLAILASYVVIGHDISVATTQPAVEYRAYFALLSVAAGLFYAEDIASTPIRLQVLQPEWPAWLLATLAGFLIAMASYWTTTIRIWTERGHPSSLPSVAAALGSVILVLTIVSSTVYVLAFSSDPYGQQLTAKSAASNVLQGQFLYGGLLVIALVVPIEIFSRLTKDITTDLPPLVAFCAFAALLWGVYRFTAKQNSGHLASEKHRDIPQIHRRTKDPANAAILKAVFIKRLATHIKWQERFGRLLLGVSLVGLGAVIYRAKESVGAEAGPSDN
jgi:hypothetical protein